MPELDLTPKQLQLFTDKADFCFFGGGKFSGKTYSLVAYLMGKCAKNPNYQAMFVRPYWGSIDELDSTIRELQPIFGGKIYSRPDKRIAWPNGSTLRLKALNKAEDETKIRGANLHAICIDECPLLDPAFIETVTTATRKPGYKTKVLFSGNPGVGPSLPYLIDTFIEPSERLEPVEDRYWVWEKDGLTYSFIQSNVDDNTAISEQARIQYKAQLNTMNEASRQAYLFGNWRYVRSAFMPKVKEAVLVKEVDWDNDTIVFALDLGVATGGLVGISIDHTGHLHCFYAHNYTNTYVTEIGNFVLNEFPRHDYFVVDKNNWNTRGPEGTTYKQLLKEIGLNPQPHPIKNRVEGWIVLRDLLSTGKLTISPDAYELVEQLNNLVPKPTNVDDALNTGEDHIADACRQAVTWIHVEGNKPLDPETKHIEEYNEWFEKTISDIYNVDSTRYINR